MNYIVLAIPAFFLLIGIELLIDRVKKTNYYRFNDAITNMNCGVGSQVLGVFLRSFIYIGYYFLYQNYKLFELPEIGKAYSSFEIILTSFVLFIGVDFFYYWFHRLAHEINIMWGSHVVHHQSEEYNLTVALRQGWVQSAFSWVFYLPLAIIGFQPELFILVNAFQTLYQFWIHTKTIDKMPRWFEYIFNTPSHHRVHHGINSQYIDKNHGGTLIIFDRMFGTFEPEQEEVVYGITQQPKSWNPFWLNIEHWWNLLKDFIEVEGLKNKWHILFNAPGWQPEGYVAGKGEFNPSQFSKYDTYTPKNLNYYIFIHNVLVLAATTLFLFNTDKFSWSENSIFGLLIIWSLVNLGAMFELKKWLYVSEISRLIALLILSMYLLNSSGNIMLAVMLPLILFIISISVFLSIHGSLRKFQKTL